MTQPHIIRKVRKNSDFIHATRELDRLGIPWTLCPPRGGHPYLEVGERALRYPIGCSPSDVPGVKVLGQIRRWLVNHGFNVRNGD